MKIKLSLVLIASFCLPLIFGMWLLLVAPLYVFSAAQDYGMRTVSLPWSEHEKFLARAMFDQALSPELNSEIQAYIRNRSRVLSPFSSAETPGIAIRVSESYANCHDYILEDTGQVLPVTQHQQFDGQKCIYKVSAVSADRQRQQFSALLTDPGVQKPSRLILMRKEERILRVVAQREAWIRQHFFTADGQLWYSRDEDRNSYAPDPCLLWKVGASSDECVLWSHALNNLPAYEGVTFYAGSTPGHMWITIAGEKTNRLYAGRAVEATSSRNNEWLFRDTHIRGIARAAALGDELFYTQVQNPGDVLRSAHQSTSLWRISESGENEQILALAEQSKRWTTRNGVLQVALQAMPGIPAKLARWQDGGWQEMPLTPVQKASSFLGFGNHTDMVSYYDAMGQQILAIPDVNGWRENMLTKHPAGTRLQKFRVASADGNTLDCLVVDRGDQPVKPPATMIRIYGAYGVPSLPFPQLETMVLLQSGVRLVYPQTRGGNNGGETWAHAARGEGRARVVEDAEACMQELIQRGMAEPGKIISWGGSAGAIPAYWLLQRNPGLVAATVLKRPYLAMQMQDGIKNEVEFGSLEQQVSRKNIDKLSPYSSMLAGQLQHGKVLFLCGGEDINTPDWHCRASQTALRLRGHRQSWMYIAEHSDHHGLPPLHPETQTELRLLVNFVLKAGER